MLVETTWQCFSFSFRHITKLGLNVEMEIFHSLQFDFKLHMDRLNPSPFENVLIFVNHRYYEYEQKADKVDETETKDS